MALEEKAGLGAAEPQGSPRTQPGRPPPLTPWASLRSFPGLLLSKRGKQEGKELMKFLRVIFSVWRKRAALGWTVENSSWHRGLCPARYGTLPSSGCQVCCIHFPIIANELSAFKRGRGIFLMEKNELSYPPSRICPKGMKPGASAMVQMCGSPPRFRCQNPNAQTEN